MKSVMPDLHTFLKEQWLRMFVASTCYYFLLSPCESQPVPPADMKNCPLNASAPFSNVIMVFDGTERIQKEPGPACFGSLVTSNAVLTTAWYFLQALDQFSFDMTITKFNIIAQNIWDYRGTKGRYNPCYQLNTASRVIFHPKSKEFGERLYFDYSILVLKNPYRMEKLAPNPPLSFFPIDALELLLQIRYVNIYSYSAPCLWPLPLHIDEHWLNWVFNDATTVYSIPYRKRCVPLICEQKAPGTPEAECRKVSYKLRRKGPVTTHTFLLEMFQKFDARLNATVLCMIPGWKNYHLEAQKSEFIPSPYSGVPLMCNGSLLGQAVQVKSRQGYREYPKDFVFVSTLLRVFPWLINSVTDLLPTPSAEAGQQDDTYEEFATPSRLPTPNWGRNEFQTLSADDLLLDPRLDPKATALPSCRPYLLKTILIVAINFSLNIIRIEVV